MATSATDVIPDSNMAEPRTANPRILIRRVIWAAGSKLNRVAASLTPAYWLSNYHAHAVTDALALRAAFNIPELNKADKYVMNWRELLFTTPNAARESETLQGLIQGPSKVSLDHQARSWSLSFSPNYCIETKQSDENRCHKTKRSAHGTTSD